MPGLVRALADRRAAGSPLVELLGRVHLSLGPRVCCLSTGEARLLAFLALRRGENDRRVGAGSLWPDVDETRAGGNLRSALWRLNALPAPLVEVGRATVALHASVLVDVRLLADWAARMISGERDPADLRHAPWDVGGVDLLPGWQDEWILLERERLRQRLLHGLECMSTELVQRGRCAEAVEIALIAVSADGLRESAQRVLIEAHLAEGNWAEARRCFRAHSEMLERELGVPPSPHLAALVAPPVTLRPRRGPGGRAALSVGAPGGRPVRHV